MSVFGNASGDVSTLPQVIVVIGALAAVAVVLAVVRWLFRSGRRAAAGVAAFVWAGGSVPAWTTSVRPELQRRGWWP